MRLKKLYTSREVAALTGLSARQLQWWHTRRLFVPSVAPHKTESGGFTERRYTPVELLELMVLADLRRRGFSIAGDSPTARRVAFAIQGQAVRSHRGRRAADPLHRRPSDLCPHSGRRDLQRAREPDATAVDGRTGPEAAAARGPRKSSGRKFRSDAAARRGRGARTAAVRALLRP